jgi:hypothetical protein
LLTSLGLGNKFGIYFFSSLEKDGNSSRFEYWTIIKSITGLKLWVAIIFSVSNAIAYLGYLLQMIEWSAMNYIMRIENYRSIGEIAYDFEAEGSRNVCY